MDLNSLKYGYFFRFLSRSSRNTQFKRSPSPLASLLLLLLTLLMFFLLFALSLSLSASCCHREGLRPFTFLLACRISLSLFSVPFAFHLHISLCNLSFPASVSSILPLLSPSSCSTGLRVLFVNLYTRR